MKSVNTMKAMGVALALITLAVFASINPSAKRAEAATPYAQDKVASFNGALSATTASIMTAISDRQIVVKAIELTATTACTIQFEDGDGTDMFTLYLAANTPRVLTNDSFGAGSKTASGTALKAFVSGGTPTLTTVIRYNVE